MLNGALSIIQEEHRSLAAVVTGLRYLVHQSRVDCRNPDFAVLRAIVTYLNEFPEKLHHPKENSYLFARLRERTHEADSVIELLKLDHAEGGQKVRDLERALDRFQAGAAEGMAEFSAAAEAFAEAMLAHMAIEEQELFPLACIHLRAEDWVEIAAAFGENGDPRFDAAADLECRDLFSRILKLAPTPRGGSPGV